MAFNNSYNQEIKKKLNKIYNNLIINEHNNNNNDNVPYLKGSSGFGMGSNFDEGYEPTLGATSEDSIKTQKLFKNVQGMSAGKKRVYKKKIKISVGDGMSAGGMSAGGMTAGGMTAGKRVYKKKIKKIQGGDFMDSVKNASETIKNVAESVAPFMPLILGLGKKKGRPKKFKGGELTLKGFDNQKGQPEQTTNVQTGPSASPLKLQKSIVDKSQMPSKIGFGKKNARAEIVKKIMNEKGLKMIDASKYVKEHNLYQKK